MKVYFILPLILMIAACASKKVRHTYTPPQEDVVPFMETPVEPPSIVIYYPTARHDLTVFFDLLRIPKNRITTNLEPTDSVQYHNDVPGPGFYAILGTRKNLEFRVYQLPLSGVAEDAYLVTYATIAARSAPIPKPAPTSDPNSTSAETPTPTSGIWGYYSRAGTTLTQINLAFPQGTLSTPFIEIEDPTKASIKIFHFLQTTPPDPSPVLTEYIWNGSTFTQR